MTASLALLAYLLGSLSPATIIARQHGIDIRASGSGNPGATNVLRLLGRRSGALVLALDFAKGALPTLLALLLTVPLHHAALIGFAAIAGHSFPVFYKFQGGKGVATTAGVVSILQPFAFLIAILAFALIYGFGRVVSLASIGSALVLAGSSSSAEQLSHPLSSEALNSWFIFLISGLVIFRHSGNIRRLVRGEEKSLKLTPTEKTCEPLEVPPRTSNLKLDTENSEVS